jgi:hypothetical protein
MPLCATARCGGTAAAAALSVMHRTCSANAVLGSMRRPGLSELAAGRLLLIILPFGNFTLRLAVEVPRR